MNDGTSIERVLRGEARWALVKGEALAVLRSLPDDGRLRAVVDAKGVHHFARAEVLAFADQRRPHADRVHGAIAAQVFALFRESVELPEIVMKTQQSPSMIRALYEEYRRPLESRPAPPVPELGDYEKSSRELDEKVATLQARGPLISGGFGVSGGRRARGQ